MAFLPSDTELVFPHILRVEASAGSGKTFLLACRFIQFLLSERIPRSRLQNLLAITFTKAATAEMRRRILDLLKDAAFGDSGVLGAIGPLVDIPGARLRDRAAGQVDEILSRYDDWQVRTIDSFLNRLVDAAPHELGLTHQEEMEPHEAPFRAEALDRLLLRAGREAEIDELLEKAVAHYVHFEEKGAWWPRATLLATLEDFSAREATSGLDLAGADSGGGPRSFMLKNALEAGAQAFLEDVDLAGVRLHGNKIGGLKSVAEGRVLAGLGGAPWKYEAVLAFCTKNQTVPGELETAWAKLRLLAAAFAEARARETPAPYLRLLAPWKEELSGLKSASRVLFFGDINRLARRLYDEFILSELIFRLGDRLRHFLIDEFQDTSRLQWENLRPLLENALAERGSAFLVGDRKQVLYRWRGSDPEIFRTGPESFPSLGKAGLLDIGLDHNWRSREVLLGVVGRLFSPESLGRWLLDETVWGEEAPEPELILPTFSHVAQTVPPAMAEARRGGYARLERLEPEADPEARVVAILQDEILPRRAPGEVLVLVRDNKEMASLTALLSEAGIPAYSQREMDVRENPTVRGLLQWLRLLSSPWDETALASVLSGELLAPLWEACGPGGDPWAWMERTRLSKTSLRAALRLEAPELWERAFLSLFRMAGPLPVYDLAALVARAFAVEARFPDDAEALRHLFQVMHDRDHGGDAAAFLDFVETGAEEAFTLKGDGRPGAVRLMTIHGAKGLEAPVVILPRAALAVRGEGRLCTEEEGGLELWHTSRELRTVSPRLRALYQTEKSRAWNDELCVLYVALTRAREEMIVLVPPGPRNGKNLMLPLIEPLFPDVEAKSVEWGAPLPTTRAGLEAEAPAEARAPGAPGPLSVGEPSWPRFLRRRVVEPTALLSAERRRAIGLGEALHRLLARLTLPLEGPPDPEALSERLRSEAEALFGPVPPEGVDFSALAGLLTRPEARPLFWPGPGAEIWVEKEVADAAGNLYRLDRLVREPSGLWIGEFKSGARPRREDREQLLRYRGLVSALFPGQPVRGLLFYFERGEIEEAA